MTFIQLRSVLITLVTLLSLLCSTQSFASWAAVWGTTPPNAVGLGMWSLHLRPSSGFYTYNNKGAAVLYKSAFAATFVNCFNRQSFAAGVQRTVYTHPLQHNIDFALGYRLGGLTGYDKRFAQIAEETPVLPFAQLVADFTYKRAGVELTYTGVTTSAMFIIKF